MALEEYRRKRRFDVTPEPSGKVGKRKAKELTFVIQKHAATRLHYDFRLEMEGVLRSWAVPKGPSLDPGEKRLAVHVEDHPLDYGTFEGIIPKGQYGGGTVLLWDQGTWHPEGDPVADYRKGRLKFRLDGEKLQGSWMLVRMHGDRAGEDKENWLLVKEKDETAEPGSGEAVIERNPQSVASGLSLEEIAANPERVWQSNREEKVKTAARRAGAKAVTAKKAAGSAVDPKAIEGARKAKMPERVEAQLATLVDEVPRGAEWIHELKFDGYRALCHVQGGKARVITRNAKDWTDRFAVVARAVERLPVREAVLDGEVVVLEPNGTSSFQALQNAMSEGRENDLVYFAFDLLHLDGYDLRRAPLLARKEALGALVADLSGDGPGEGTIRFSDHVQGSGEDFYRQACGFALEGVIAKRGDLGYHGGRNKDWLKIKCVKRQELVIAGFTEPAGSRVGFGALLLGVYEGDDLVFAGKVGTGFNDKTLREMRRRLGKMEVKESPFTKTPRPIARKATREAARGDVHWVRPELVGEVAFTEWTREGILRHPTFQGLREDKSPRQVVRETPQAPPEEKKKPAARSVAARPAAKTATRKAAAKKKAAPPPKLGPERTGKTTEIGEIGEIGGVRLSSPGKVLYPEQGVTKSELALYYERIADWILPHIENRPLTLVRCPEGQAKECFYQKHVNERFPAAVHRVEVDESAKAVPYGAIDSLKGLISLVQMGALELHIWGSRRDQIEKPDYVVFDLDPDEGLGWERVVEGALRVRDRLAGLGLETFLKTTGGKGLHVVLPLTRRLEWDEVKAFTKAVSEDIAASEPDRYTSKLPKVRRQGKIFIDYLRNGRGATSIAAFSTRARPGAPVSAPLFWEELESDVRANTFNVRNLPQRLASLRADPWEGIYKVRQSITAAMKKAVGMT